MIGQGSDPTLEAPPGRVEASLERRDAKGEAIAERRQRKDLSRRVSPCVGYL